MIGPTSAQDAATYWSQLENSLVGYSEGRITAWDFPKLSEAIPGITLKVA
jgi:hypothetical protein